jgi:hypothetical protein
MNDDSSRDPSLKLELGGSPDAVAPMQCDKWVATSAMQKAIRRGDARTAQCAAIQHYQFDRPAVWRRLMIIAIEDVGIGAIDAVVEAATRASDANRRKQLGGDVPAILDTCRLLAEAAKDRSSDYLPSVAVHDAELEETRKKIGRLPVARRLERLADETVPLPDRFLAARYTSNLASRSERAAADGDLSCLMRAFANLGVRGDLLEAIHIAARKTREPLVFSLPLLALEAARANTEIDRRTLNEAQFVGDVPLYALDGNIRLGRAAIKLFRNRNQDLAKVARAHVQNRSADRAVQLAVFFADSAPTSPRVLWDLGKQLEVRGVAADFAGVGVDPDVGRELIEIARRNLAHLNAIRADALARALIADREERPC